MAGRSTVHSPHPSQRDSFLYMHTGVCCANACSRRRTPGEDDQPGPLLAPPGLISEPRSLALWMFLTTPHARTRSAILQPTKNESTELVITLSIISGYFVMAQGVLAQFPVMGSHVCSKHSAAASRAICPLSLPIRGFMQRQPFAQAHNKFKAPRSHIAESTEQGISSTISPAEARDDDVESLQSSWLSLSSRRTL